MNAITLSLVLAWTALVAYTLFGGADFGAGIWHLAAGRAGQRQRDLIDHAIGPVWEANHVWLIFSIIVVWTAFPPVFATVSSTAYLPLTLVAVGLIGRGAAFAFRKAHTGQPQRRLFGAVFGLSSIIVPFLLGAVAGGIASGRFPVGLARGNLLTSWLNPTSVLTGVLAVSTCAFLAAVYLTADARRESDLDCAEMFRRRATLAGIATLLLALSGIGVAYLDAPRLFAALTQQALPAVALASVAGAAAVALVRRRRYLWARVAAAFSVAAMLAAWALAQHPVLLEPRLTAEAAAAPIQVLRPMLVVLGSGAALIAPALGLMYWISQRTTSE